MRTIVCFTAIALCLSATPAAAQDSIKHASQAITGASEVVGHLAASGIDVVGGVVALPLAAVGGASVMTGAVSQAAGEGFSEAGTGLVGAAEEILDNTWGPLAVDDKVVVRPDPAPQLPYAPGGARR